MSEGTRILEAIERGEPQAIRDLMPLFYDELRRLAARKIAHEKPSHTLDATALVHEAYMRLATSGSDPGWADQRRFFAAADEAMRRILVENARRNGRLKYGGGRRRADIRLDDLAASEPPSKLLALHEALEEFARREPFKAKLVELRFFGGLTLEQAALRLNVSLSTADRAWRYARAWLHSAMADSDLEKSDSS